MCGEKIQIRVYYISDTDARYDSQNAYIQHTRYIFRILDAYRYTSILSQH